MNNEWSVFVLESNHRCGAAICSAADRLASHNATRLEKRTVPVGTGPGFVREQANANPASELSWLANKVADYSADPVNAADVAVLARTNRLADEAAAHLSGLGIPVARDQAPPDPPQWKRTKLLLTVLENPFSDAAVYRLLADLDPAKAKAAKLDAAAKCVGLNESLGFPFGHGGGPSAMDVDMLKHGVPPEARERVHEACRELSAKGPWTIGDLVIYLASQERRAGRQPGVFAGTVHGAKGREWDHVFAIGCEEGTWPSSRKDADLEEERRLFYVALTRARRSFTASWCRERPQSRGPNVAPGPMEARERSRFIAEAGL